MTEIRKRHDIEVQTITLPHGLCVEVEVSSSGVLLTPYKFGEEKVGDFEGMVGVHVVFDTDQDRDFVEARLFPVSNPEKSKSLVFMGKVKKDDKATTKKGKGDFGTARDQLRYRYAPRWNIPSPWDLGHMLDYLARTFPEIPAGTLREAAQSFREEARIIREFLETYGSEKNWASMGKAKTFAEVEEILRKEFNFREEYIPPFIITFIINGIVLRLHEFSRGVTEEKESRRQTETPFTPDDV